MRMNGTDVIQVLLNLAVNAFQCSRSRMRLKSKAACCPQPLDLAAFKDGPQDRLLNVENFENTAPLLMLSVRDTGPGIPPEILAEDFPAVFLDQRRAAGHRPGTEYRPAPRQGGQGRAACPHPGRGGHDLYGLPSGRAAGRRLAALAVASPAARLGSRPSISRVMIELREGGVEHLEQEIRVGQSEAEAEA